MWLKINNVIAKQFMYDFAAIIAHHKNMLKLILVYAINFSGVAKNSAPEKASHGSPSTNNSKRTQSKTIYDLMAHMSGRLVPGIPINQALPADPTERVLQLHWQHSTLLTFLRYE